MPKERYFFSSYSLKKYHENAEECLFFNKHIFTNMFLE